MIELEADADVCDRTPTSDAWRFANTGVTRAVSIMAYCE